MCDIFSMMHQLDCGDMKTYDTIKGYNNFTTIYPWVLTKAFMNVSANNVHKCRVVEFADTFNDKWGIITKYPELSIKVLASMGGSGIQQHKFDKGTKRKNTLFHFVQGMYPDVKMSDLELYVKITNLKELDAQMNDAGIQDSADRNEICKEFKHMMKH